jgi:hypothetical protein
VLVAQIDHLEEKVGCLAPKGQVVHFSLGVSGAVLYRC